MEIEKIIYMIFFQSIFVTNTHPTVIGSPDRGIELPSNDSPRKENTPFVIGSELTVGVHLYDKDVKALAKAAFTIT